MANVVRIVVDAANHTGRVFSAISRSAGRMIHNIAQGFASGTGRLMSVFQDGIGGALKSALSTPYVGPIIIGALAAAVQFAAPVIAAVIASALTLGLGAALVGIGAMILLKNKKVKDGLTKDFKEAGKNLEGAFKPLLPVLEHVGDLAKKLSVAFSPFIAQAMKATAPHLEKFLNNLGDAMLKLAPAISPLMDAFNKILDDLGPELPGMFEDISDSLIKMFDAVGDNPEVFTETFKIAMDIIVILIEVIAKLTDWVQKNIDAWQNMWDVITDGWDKVDGLGGRLKDFFSNLGSSIGDAVSNIKDKLGGLKDSIRGLKGKTIHIAQSGAEKVKDAVLGVIGTIRRYAGKTVRIAQSGAAGARSAVQSVISTIRRFVGKVVRVGANVFGAGAIRNLMGWIRNLTGKTVNVVANVIGAGKSLLGFAAGGVVGAASGGPRSGMVMVGEQGRELVKLAPGSQVIPHGRTEAMMAGGGGPSEVVIRIEGNDSKTGKFLLELLRTAIKDNHGGNAQKALGRA